MSKSFNPTQTLICHLCGELYTEEKGHNPVACEGTLLERVARLERELVATKKKREAASLVPMSSR